jgi:leucine dehydrogenase
LINVAAELDGYNHEKVVAKVSQVYNTIANILEISASQGIPPHQAADTLAQQKIEEVKKLQAASKLVSCTSR